MSNQDIGGVWKLLHISGMTHLSVKQSVWLYLFCIFKAGFLNFWKAGGFIACVRKTPIKAVYFTKIIWNLIQ